MDLTVDVNYALRVTASLFIDTPINTTYKTILMRNPEHPSIPQDEVLSEIIGKYMESYKDNVQAVLFMLLFSSVISFKRLSKLGVSS